MEKLIKPPIRGLKASVKDIIVKIMDLTTRVKDIIAVLVVISA